MKVGQYRNKATDGFTYNDLVNYGYDKNNIDLIPIDEINTVLDCIESDIKEINGLLESINGLSEIDEIKEKLNSLEMKLY